MSVHVERGAVQSFSGLTPVSGVHVDRRGLRPNGYPSTLGANHWTHRRPELVVRGERHAAAKLTASKVRAIRAARGRLEDIARAFGVSKTCVKRVRARRTWRHVA